MRRSEIPTYAALHMRLSRVKGKASSYACAECGQPADEWSYIGGDPDELVSKQGRPYSLDLDRYRPLCRRCHHRADRRREVCPQGHLMTEDNLSPYYLKRGQHLCERCLQDQRRRDRNKARERYQNDPEYRAKKLAADRERYAQRIGGR